MAPLKKPPKVLLINPWIYDFTAYDLWLRPLGLLYVGSILKRYGYQVFLIDTLNRYDPLLLKFLTKKEKKKIQDKRYGTGNFYHQIVEKPDCFREIPRHFKRYGMRMEVFNEHLRMVPEPDIIGITSGMTYWYPGVFKVIEILKENFRGVPIVLGGIYATLCYEHAKKYSSADRIVKGRKLTEILKTFDEISGIDRDYSGVEEDNSLFPLYELIPGINSVGIITSSGCPYRCSYCASWVLEKYQRRKSEDVIAEIEYYVKTLKIKDIAFYDDALFMEHREYMNKILSWVIYKKLPVRFHTPNGVHAKEIDFQLAKNLKKANFKTIRIGLETISEEKLREKWNSKVNRNDFKNCIENLRRAGLIENTGVYVMIGARNQELEEILETLEFVHKMGVRVYLAQYSPVPETPEYKKFVKQSNSHLYREPLLTNKAIYPLKNPDITYERFERLKDFVKCINRNIDKRINFWKEAKKFALL